ncbi:MAG TPA: VWA domain-containing protein [Rudaea sp.]
MSALLGDFHFLRPWWLLALLALPLLWRVLRAVGSDGDAWRNAVDAHLLDHLIVRTQTAPVRAPRWLAAAGWIVACVALAGPAWERLPTPLYRNHAARVIALELAPSMLAQDLKPSRLDRARYKIADILRRSGDAQTALIAYASDAFVVAPLTDDANTVSNLLDALDPSVMPVPGNDAAKAIDLGVKLIQQAGLSGGEIVLVADSAGGNATAAALRAHAAGVNVSALGIGSADGAPVALPQGGFLKDTEGRIVLPKLDGAGLTQIVRIGDGRYASFTPDAGDLDALLAPLTANVEAAAQASAQSARFLDRGPWLLLLLIPLAASAFRRGWAMLLPLALCVHSPTASASLWNDLWQRPDQQARAQLDAGNAKEAQALARDPSLRGSAAYRAGDYADAASDFDQPDSADAQYNRANALAKQGRYEEALKAYDAALAKSPDMDDAKANRTAVEDWLKRQKKQDQPDQKSDKSDSDDHKGDEQQKPGEGSSSDQKSDQDQQQKNDKDSSSNADDKDKQQSGQSQSDRDKSGRDEQSQQQSDKSSDKTQTQQGREADQKAQQQFQQEMDKAVNGEKKPETERKPVRLGAVEGDGRDEKQQAVEQWLQRVPDDPGGLLRRKFLLEYQRRQDGRGSGDHP